MKNVRKLEKTLIFIFLVLIIFLGGLIFTWTPRTREYSVTIQGNIKLDNQSLNWCAENLEECQRLAPLREVEVYSENMGNRPVPRNDAELLGSSSIKWDDEITKGTFLISFSIPYSKRVVVETSCDNYDTLDLDIKTKKYSINMSYEFMCDDKVKESLYDLENVKFLSKRREDMVLRKLSNDKNLGIEERNKINGFLSYSAEENKTLDPYIDYWNSIRADYVFAVLSLNDCVKKTRILTNEYNPLFFTLQYNQKKKFEDSQESLENLNNTGFMTMHVQDIYWDSEDKEKLLLSSIDILNKRTERAWEAEETCKNNLKSIIENFNYLRPIIRFKKVVAFMVLAVVFVLGLFLRDIFKKALIKEKEKEKPKKHLDNEGVQIVLKLETTVLVINALVVALDKYLDQKFYGLLVGTSLVSSILIIVSLIFGLLYLKEKSEKFADLCWGFMFWGLVFFVFVVIEIFLIYGLLYSVIGLTKLFGVPPGL